MTRRARAPRSFSLLRCLCASTFMRRCLSTHPTCRLAPPPCSSGTIAVSFAFLAAPLLPSVCLPFSTDTYSQSQDMDGALEHLSLAHSTPRADLLAVPSATYSDVGEEIDVYTYPHPHDHPCARPHPHRRPAYQSLVSDLKALSVPARWRR
ncbi:hypothetical protein B0H14DRAFT_1223287 [Mycena olivaceomarginata]|nr:hypothetical protein B0H14DRAFT_1223287 [Mycena olivaceomarginata]